MSDLGGNFTDSGASMGMSYSYTVDLGDVDGDGDLDAFVANWGPLSDGINAVWLNTPPDMGDAPAPLPTRGRSTPI